MKGAIREFDGTVVIVSHDREFLDGLVTKVYEFGGGKVKEYLGGIYDFLQKKNIDSLNELQLSKSQTQQSIKNQDTQAATTTGRLSYEQQKELARQLRKLEKEVTNWEAKIEELETKIAQLEETLTTPEGAANTALYTQHGDLKKQLDEAVEAWEKASEALEEATSK